MASSRRPTIGSLTEQPVMSPKRPLARYNRTTRLLRISVTVTDSIFDTPPQIAEQNPLFDSSAIISPTTRLNFYTDLLRFAALLSPYELIRIVTDRGCTTVLTRGKLETRIEEGLGLMIRRYGRQTVREFNAVRKANLEGQTEEMPANLAAETKRKILDVGRLWRRARGLPIVNRAEFLRKKADQAKAEYDSWLASNAQMGSNGDRDGSEEDPEVLEAAGILMQLRHEADVILGPG